MNELPPLSPLNGNELIDNR